VKICAVCGIVIAGAAVAVAMQLWNLCNLARIATEALVKIAEKL
jgi:hypothetical protein